jgi:hypothetical protein
MFSETTCPTSTPKKIIGRVESGEDGGREDPFSNTSKYRLDRTLSLISSWIQCSTTLLVCGIVPSYLNQDEFVGTVYFTRGRTNTSSGRRGYISEVTVPSMNDGPNIPKLDNEYHIVTPSGCRGLAVSLKFCLVQNRTFCLVMLIIQVEVCFI